MRPGWELMPGGQRRGQVMMLKLEASRPLHITCLPHMAEMPDIVPFLFTLLSWWPTSPLQLPSPTLKTLVLHLLVKLTFSPTRNCSRSVAKSLMTLCNPMGCSTPSFPVHHQLPELTQTHVDRVGDGILSSHPLSLPFPPTLNLSQYQGLSQ